MKKKIFLFIYMDKNIYNDGRKIPSCYENPIDNILIEFSNKLTDFLYKNKISPNLITILRLVLICFVIRSLFYTNEVWFPIIGSFIFYFMDCLDGNLARSTNQVTIFGDYLDHFADLFYYIIIGLYIHVKNYDNKYYIYLIFIIFAYLTLVHLGIQQLFYKYISKNKDIEEELLDYLNNLHNLDKCNIKWTKYFGSGTFIIVILIIIYYIQSHQI